MANGATGWMCPAPGVDVTRILIPQSQHTPGQVSYGAPRLRFGMHLDEELRAVVGKPMRSGPSVAPDPVNQAMIRHWAAAFDDRNPVYTDPAAATASRFGGIIAPPLMLQTWTMPTPMLDGIRERGGAPQESDGSGPLAALDRAGYTGTLATNSEYEILRPLRLGDVISSSTVIESISEPKRTRMGDSRFVTWLTTYTDDTGEIVGRQRFRIVKFVPPGITVSTIEAGE